MNKQIQQTLVIMGWLVLAEVINEVVGYKMIEVDLNDKGGKGK